MPIEIDISENAAFKRAQRRGVALGEARGEAKGEAKVLLRLLERRFGPLPESVRARIASADIDSLDLWVDPLHGAPSLDEVFADRASVA